jgi:adenine/guanine/hypoxanthine permease
VSLGYESLVALVKTFSHSAIAVKRDLITATAAIAGLSTVSFGFLTNMPVALAPGMGLNAYFAYRVY